MISYEKLLNKKIQNIKPSGIRKFFDIAAEMDDVISLSIGEPDFHTPWHIRDAGIRSLEKGRTHYTANSGLIQLREEVSSYMKQKQGISYDPTNEILITVGGSEAIDLAIRSIVDVGDEVLIPEPSFVCYDPITTLAGGVPVKIETKVENNFRLTAQELKNAITNKTKLLIMPFPNNPTGAVMRRQHLEEIAEVLRGTDILILSDEIYGELTYGDTAHVSIASLEGMQERTILVNGFSKAYAMTGWRLGYICAPAPLTKAMTKLHQYAIMSSPTVSQHAAIEAIKNGDEDIALMRQEYDTRRRLTVDGFRNIGLDCFEPEGAFYVFPCIKSTGLSSEDFCEQLLRSQHVAIVPGTAFGECGQGFVRVSYCYSTKHLLEALDRIEKFLRSLRGR